MIELIILGIVSVVAIILIFFAFLAGLHYGSMIRNDETIKKPTLSPIKIVKDTINESKNDAKTLKEQEIEDTILANIDAYDGTGYGQKDIPK